MTPDTWVIRLFQLLRFVWVAVIAIGVVCLIQIVTPLLYPFLIALLIAVAVNRPVTFLCEKARLPRWLSVLLVLLALLAILGGVLTLIITGMVIEIGDLIEKMPVYMTELTLYLQQAISQDFLGIYNRFEFFYDQLDESYKQTINTNVGNALNAISQAGKQLVSDLLSSIKSLLLSLPNFATILVISLLAAFFFSKDYYLWTTRFRRLLPGGVNRRIDQVFRDLRQALVGFIKAQLTLISLTAAIVIVGLLILRVDYAVTIGLLTGLVDLLPYLGTGTVFIPWIAYSFFKGNYEMVIGLSILYGVVVIFRQIIEPKVVADNVGLDPLLTLVALFVGLNLFGFVGLIVGPVSLVVINALIKARVFQDIWEFIKGKPLDLPR